MITSVNQLHSELIALNEAFSKLVPANDLMNRSTGNTLLPTIYTHQISFVVRQMIDFTRESEFIENDQMIELIDDIRHAVTSIRINSLPHFLNHLHIAGMVFGELFLLQANLYKLAQPTEGSDIAKRLLSAKRQTSAIEARLTDLGPRSSEIEEKIKRIEAAHEIADQLPVDLADLVTAKTEMTAANKDMMTNAANITLILESSRKASSLLDDAVQKSEETVSRLDSAYSAATSQGLAAAFSERSKALDRTMWYWVVGLVIALLGAVFGGGRQLADLLEQITAPNASRTLITAKSVLTAVSIGAPVWFAWLSTKQIGHRFRLSEDYGFKAAVSKAYEGFRKETVRVDPEFEKRLLASALSRLDEQPLRLVETATHGSPWQELASSDAVKEALKLVPDASSKLIQAARDMLTSQAKSVTTPTPPPTPPTP